MPHFYWLFSIQTWIHLQVEHTPIWCNPPLGFNDGNKDAEATNSVKFIGHDPPDHKLTTWVITNKISCVVTKPTPHSVSKMYWTHKPSLPHDATLGNNLLDLNIMSILAIRGAWNNKLVEMKGVGMYECLSSKTFIVSSLYGVTIDDLHTFTVDVKWPSTTFGRYYLMSVLIFLSLSSIWTLTWPKSSFLELPNTLSINLARRYISLQVSKHP